MRWLVTLLLLVLVALGGLWLVAGERALTAVHLKKPEPDTASSPSVTALGPTLQTDSVRKVEITPTDAPTLTLAKTADGWTQPGNWPVREGVVNALVFHLTGLRTLFAVIPLANDGAYLNGLAAALGTPVFSWPEAELSQFGLTPGQLAVKVKLDIGTESSGKSLTLRFGQHGPTAGETKFSAPTYVRVDDHAEVLKLAPDVYATVARPAEVYRRRQLVPDADRAKVSGGENTARTSLLGDRYSTIAFDRTDDKPMSYTLRRTAPTPEPRRDANRPTGEPTIGVNELANAWVLEFAGPKDPAGKSAAVRDRIDPTKLRAALTLIPDLWVESFVSAADAAPAVTGLDKPTRTITIARADGKPSIIVEIGNVKRSTSKEEPGAPPAFPGAPPTPGKTITEEFRYAKLKNSEPVFELKTDKLNDLFADPSDLRDASLARFETAEVNDATVMVKGKPPVTITRKKGNKDAEKDDDKQDRWYVGDVLAEPSKVTELLDLLAKLEAKGKDDRLDSPDAAKLKELDLDTKLIEQLANLEVRRLARKASRKAAEEKKDTTKLKEIELEEVADGMKLKELYRDPTASTRVMFTARARTTDSEPLAPQRKYFFIVGKYDDAKKLLPVQVASGFNDSKDEDLDTILPKYFTTWQRVNLISLKEKEADPLATPKLDKPPTLQDFIDRPALAYRSRRLFDTAELKLENLGVAKNETYALAIALKAVVGEAAAANLKSTIAPSFGLTRVAKKAPAEGFEWRLTQPVQTESDDAKATALTGDLSRLEVTEYVDESPKAYDYGLTNPRFTIDLGFTGRDAKPQKLEIGNVREGKGDSFARLNGTGPVFTVAMTVPESVEPGALGLLPLQLWQTTADKVIALEIQRGEAAMNEKYKLAQAGTEWKLSGPFDAAAGLASLQPLLAAAAIAKADKYDALVADPKKHGLDKPAVRVAVTFKESKPGAKPTDPPVETVVTKTLLVGNETAPNATTRYARLDGGPTAAVFVIPDQLVKEADKPALGWLDKTLLAADPMKVTKVQVSGLTPESNVSLTKDDKGIWKADGTAFTVDAPTVTGLVFTVARPPVARLAAYGAAVKWADYGLDKPTATVTLTLAGDKPETHTLKLGKAEANGERYIRVDDGPAVGVVPARAAEFLAKGKLDFVDRSMLAFEPAALTAIVRKKGADDLEVSQSGLNWEVTKPAKQKADKVLIEDLAEQLARLRATKVAAFAPGDLKPFGLDNPAAIVTLKVGTDKPEDKVLKIGGLVDAAKPDSDRYATAEVKGAPVTVGVIPGELAKKLLGDPLKFRDRAMLAKKVVDVDKITLERGDRKATFEKKDGTWKLTSPIVAEAEQTDLDELVNALADLRADEIDADKPADLKPFGLAIPEAKWKLFYGDREELSLLVGSKEKDGARAFAKLEKGDLVAKLDAALSARVLGEFRKRAVWTDLDASQVQQLVISADMGTFQFVKSPAGWIDATKPTDPVDAAKIDEALAALAGLKVERFVADKDAKLNLYGLEKPARVIVVTPRGGAAKTLHLGSPVGGTDGKQVYAKLPDKSEVFVLSAADTAKLTRDRAGFGGKK